MQLEKIIKRYRELGIENQIDYSKFYLYSLITHSTAIEGSTITELENQIMFDDGVSLAGKSIEEQNMNLDLKVAYEKSFDIIKNNTPLTINILIMLFSLKYMISVNFSLYSRALQIKSLQDNILFQSNI